MYLCNTCSNTARCLQLNWQGSRAVAMANLKKRVCYMLDMNFASVEQKEAFAYRFKHIRQHLTPVRLLPDNLELMSMLFDAVESETTHTPTPHIFEHALTKSFYRRVVSIYHCTEIVVRVQTVSLCRMSPWNL